MSSFQLTMKSNNAKTGPMPVSTSAASTCPAACPLKSAGCYAEAGHVGMHWRKVTSGDRGASWGAFVAQIDALPSGTSWRHNQAGDLPGASNEINVGKLLDLVGANRGKRGFTYTHKPVTGFTTESMNNHDSVKHANANGFTVNLSANTLQHADELLALEIGPVVVVLDAEEGIRHNVTTPAGNRVVTCPATYRDDVTCKSCMLCQVADRKVIVGFPAHGVSKKKAATVARGAVAARANNLLHTIAESV